MANKVSYQSFKTLDDVLRSKYSRQIQRGTLRIIDLPLAGNMRTIEEFRLLREQLNKYLGEILKVTAKFPTSQASSTQGDASRGPNLNQTLPLIKDSQNAPNQMQ